MYWICVPVLCTVYLCTGSVYWICVLCTAVLDLLVAAVAG
eukprot:COSAG01_NODE_1167_length_11440_cov_69.256238_8_plen_39_part_01